MTRVNLIPRARIQNKRSRVRLRRWVTACAGYALFLAIALIVSNVVASGDDRSTRTDLNAAIAEKEDASQAILTLQADLAVAMESLAASLAVGDQPDWGVLLALLADTTGEEIVLRECIAVRSHDTRSSPRTTPGGSGLSLTPHAGDDDDFIVELSGLGRSQEHVSNFLLRMEQVPLFRQVKLHDTKREPFLDDHAVGFRLECFLDTGGDAQQP